MTNNKTAFELDVTRAEASCRKSQAAIKAVRQRLMDGDIEGAYRDSFSYAGASERQALVARLLPAATGNPQAQCLADNVVKSNMGIRVGFTSAGWFCIVMPSLLPKKSRAGSARYLREGLHLTLTAFFHGTEKPLYPECVIIFRHVYDRSRPERQYRDHDNIEVKAAVDSVALHVMTDDGALRCSHFYCSMAGDSDMTQIFVVHEREFDAWRQDAKSYAGGSITLHKAQPDTLKTYV